jgi:alginate O-acetyltransferase complex protein AlgI
MIYLFHSIHFLYFFFLIFFIYWLLPHKFRNIFLLISSYIFYASWDWRFLGLIIISTSVDYFCGLKIYGSRKLDIRKKFLVLSIVTNILLLAVFKYFNFFVENLLNLLNLFGINANFSTLNIILPIGISFYTFQTLSYTIDIYRNRIKPTKNIFLYSLFVAYFPQLIAGPIERAKDLIPRIKAKKFFKNINFREGFYLFFYGLFKKIVIADSVAIIVDKIYNLSNPSGSQVFIATLAFAIQIYCDFSGYTNMARGISHFFGIKLSINFRLPYFSKNPSDFWKRWHITLSKWMKDYIYVPLGGNRSKFFGFFPLLLTFFLIGLWHGASWNFVLWGIYWFVIILAYRITSYVLSKIRLFNSRINIINKIIIILSILFMFVITLYSWLIFRSKDINQIKLLSKSIFLDFSLNFFSLDYLYFYIIILFLIFYQYLQYLNKDTMFIIKKNFYYKMIFYLILFFMFIYIGPVPNIPYIYFQF